MPSSKNAGSLPCLLECISKCAVKVAQWIEATNSDLVASKLGHIFACPGSWRCPLYLFPFSMIKPNSFALHGKDKINFSVLLFRKSAHNTRILLVENWGIIKNISWQFSIIWLMNCKTMTIPQCFLQMFLSLTPPKSMKRLSLDFWGK